MTTWYNRCMYKSKYTKEALEAVVPHCRCVSDVMRKMGSKATQGGSHRVVTKKLKLFNIDTSHFDPLAVAAEGSRKHALNSRRPWKDVLVLRTDRRVVSTVLRRALLDSGAKYECSTCGVNEWNGKSLTLHVDHINGSNMDCRKDNLRFLCPNCHSQTDNFGIKNMNRQSTKGEYPSGQRMETVNFLA